MQTSLSQRRHLIAKLDNEYRLFLKELEEERAAMAEAKRLRQERAGRRRSQKAQKRQVEAAA
jgi:hypothetical protein